MKKGLRKRGILEMTINIDSLFKKADPIVSEILNKRII